MHLFQFALLVFAPLCASFRGFSCQANSFEDVFCAPIPFSELKWRLEDVNGQTYPDLKKAITPDERTIIRDAYALANQMIVGMREMVNEARAYDIQVQRHQLDKKSPLPPANPVAEEKIRIIQAVFGMPSWTADLRDQSAPMDATLKILQTDPLSIAQVSRSDVGHVSKMDPKDVNAITPWSAKGLGGPILLFDLFYDVKSWSIKRPKEVPEDLKTATRAGILIHEAIHQRRSRRDHYILTSTNPPRGKMARSTERDNGEVKIRNYGLNRRTGFQLDWREVADVEDEWKKAAGIVEDMWNCPTAWQMLSSIWYHKYGPGSIASTAPAATAGSQQQHASQQQLGAAAKLQVSQSASSGSQQKQPQQPPQQPPLTPCPPGTKSAAPGGSSGKLQKSGSKKEEKCVVM